MSIGLSILSWRGAETLKPSLESYASAGLFAEFSESQVFLPDPDDSVLSATSTFDIKINSTPRNLGIMENMATAAAAISTDYILMLENDCPLIEPLTEVRRQLTKSLKLLERDDVIMSRLRSVRAPGQAFTGLTKYCKLYNGSLKSQIINRFRPDKLRRLTGYALYDGPESIARHPDCFENIGEGFYLVDAKVMPWTNQSILINRNRFLNEIIPLARSIETKRHANKLPNLEIEMNKALLWRNSNWKIACGPGLFTHERIGDRGYA